jgi:hypothetical protein
VLPVSAYRAELRSPIRFRASNTTMVPYIAYPFPTAPGGTLPLVDLILGPGSDVNSDHAAFALLKSNAIAVWPRMSAVPYRSL